MTLNKAAVFAGAIGGIAPNLLRLAISLTADPPKEVTSQPVSYAFGILVLGGIGAFITWAWQEDNLRKAVYIGLGLPSLLQVAGSELSRPAKTNKLPANAEFTIPIVSSAYAQEGSATLTAPLPNRKLDLVGDKSSPKYQVTFFGADGGELGTKVVAKPAFETVDVPDTATKFAIQHGDSQSTAYELAKQPNAVNQVDVQISESKGNGFLQALGYQQTANADIKATVKEVMPLPSGTQGWVFLGQFTEKKGWITETVKFVGRDHLPTTGETGFVTFPLRLREGPTPNAAESGVVLASQKIAVSEIKDSGQGLYWGHIKVVQ
jgi:hypothetical protein